MNDTILAVSGRPGLYKLVAHGRGNLIIETLDESKKRIAAGARDRVTSLNDVSMYTDEEDVALMQVFQNISDKLGGEPSELSHSKATEAQLTAFMADALPNYDRDRVRFSDIRKLIQWYNILTNNGYTKFVEEAEESAETAENKD